MKFDYISDIHLDFWVKMDSNQEKMKKKIRDFVDLMLPEHPSDILLIAGDIGHYNPQNLLLFTYLKEVYKTIFYVFGNHDYYILSSRMKKRYKNSLKKVQEMEEALFQLGEIIRLNGQVVEKNGVRFGGCNMWYDLTYGTIHLGYTEEAVYGQWWDLFNDRNYHIGLPHTTKHFKEEKKKAGNLECDVFISHVPPIGIPIVREYVWDEIYLSFYTFNAEGLFTKNKPKIWISGHMHQTFQTELNGTTMLANALGYPEGVHPVPNKIKTYQTK